MGRKLRAYLVLPHLSAVIAVVTATALFGWLAAERRPPAGRFTLLVLAMLGGQLAIGALNDYLDRHDDAIANPHKPIPRGDISPSGALAMTAGGLALMLGAAAPLGWASLGVLVLAIA